MRLVTYDRGGARRLGAWVGSTVVDPPEAVGHPAFPSTLEALLARNGGTTLEAARAAIAHPSAVRDCAARNARLLVPVVPSSMHREALARPLEPRYLLGPNEALVRPDVPPSLLWELDLAAVVGGSRNGDGHDNRSAPVFGYTLLSTWWDAGTPSASPVAAAIGPCVVTAAAFDPAKARFAARIDGDQRWVGELRGVADRLSRAVVAHARRRALRPGEVVSLPLPVPPIPVRAGATLELGAEEVGVLRNRLMPRLEAQRSEMR